MTTSPKSGQEMDFIELIELIFYRSGVLPTAIIIDLARGDKT